MAANKDLTSDQRFSQVTKDPRFWEMQEKEKKIKIDKRFRAMFHDKKFNLKYSVDKRGRPVNHNTTEDLKRYYDLSESEEEAEMALNAKKEKKKKEKQKQKDEPKSKETSTKIIKEKKEAETSEGMNKSKAEKQEKGNKLSKKKNNNNEDIEMKAKPSVSVPLKSAEKSAKVTEQLESEEESGLEDGSDQSSNDEISSDEEASGMELEEDEKSEDDGSEEESGEEDDDDDDEGASSGEEEDSDSGPDLARGKGNIETSSEEEDEDEDELDLPGKEIEIEHSWREMDKDAPRGDQVTRRLAVCNMDWDRLKAKDLLALFNSFKPKGGIVFSVKIYPSEFGKERLKEEELHGPTELKNISEDVSEEQNIYKEKLREYQFKRLKYYYAVVECDTPETASKIYEECDGLEFESSCSFVDLRFVPDDVQFDDEPKDSAVDVDLSAYQPKYFTSAAVVTSKVELTWDETDQERVTTLNRPFNKKEILDMDFQAYLASSSEEEEDEEIVQEESTNPEVTKSKKSSKDDEDQIERYRQLLKGIQEKEKKQQEKDIEMEVKWVPGLKESAEQMVKNKLEGKDTLTPWEKYLQKQKDKKKLKRKKKESVEESDDEEDVPSDVDLNDPFFAEEMKKPGLRKKSAGGKKKEDQESSPDDDEESEKQKAEMALLMMDDVEDDRKHFNYDKIVEHQNLSRTKKKKLKKSDKLVQDDFEINVEDSRFQAMYTSHLYNVDPSDPSFKKTKAMDKVLEEKARRREREQKNYTETVKRQQETLETGDKTGTSARKVDPALSALLKSIKNKTQQFQATKKQKTK